MFHLLKHLRLLPIVLGITAISIAQAAPKAVVAPQKPGEELRLLHVAPLTGNLSATGKGLNDAIIAYTNEVQKNGEVPFKIQVKTVDDGYVADKSLALSKEEAKAFKPHALLAMVGTANIKALIEKKFFDEYPGALVGARSGAPLYHKQLVHLRSSYSSEVYKLMELAQIQGLNTVGVMYQDDDFGKDGLAAAQSYAAKNPSMKIVATGGYTRNTTDVQKAFDAIKAATPKTVIMVSSTNATAAFVALGKEESAKSNLKMHYMTVSATDAEQVSQKIGAKAQGLVVSQIVPSLYDPRFAISTEFLKFAERNKLSNNPTVFEGYIIARITVEAAKRVKGPLTPQSLLAELRSKPVSVGGLQFNLPNPERTTTFVDTLIIGSGNQLYY
jgi:branched-chain amino acid transport system substrate-binding protein